MILVIDNYDSFVHNLTRYFRLEGATTNIVRNDACTADDALALDPSAVVLSPGPKGPADAGVCIPLLKRLPKSIPVLGVCLGHQCLVEALGGGTTKARRPLHGQAAKAYHDGEGLFMGLPSPISVGRYHSLISVLDGAGLDTCAQSEEGEIMAVKGKGYPWFGVQFHPESVLTPEGRHMVRNFLSYVRNDG